jgi:hypothetical protein
VVHCLNSGFKSLLLVVALAVTVNNDTAPLFGTVGTIISTRLGLFTCLASILLLLCSKWYISSAAVIGYVSGSRPS